MRKKKRLIQMSLFIMAAFLLAQPLSFAAKAAPAETGNNWQSVLDSVDNFFNEITLSNIREDINQKHGIKISPYISKSLKFTSNVFGAPNNGNNTSDAIWTIKPGVRVTHKGDYGNSGINYNASLRYFSRASLQNEQDQFFTVWANLKTSENTFLKISETLNQVGSTAAVEDAEPTNFLDNTLAVIGGYNTEKTNYSFGYRMFDRDFSTTGAKHFNYNEDIYSITADHDLSTYSENLDGVRGHASIRLGNVEYSKTHTRDATWIETPVGISAPLPMDVKLNAEMGLYHRNQENPNRNDSTWITTNVSLKKVIDNRTQVIASFRRYPQEATFGGAAVSDNKKWAMDVKHIASKKLRLRGNLSYANMDIEQSSFIGNRAFVGGFLIFIPSNRVKRHDNTLALNVGADYKLSKAIRLHADYNLQRRDSNISALDMVENSFTLRASVAV